MIQHGPVEAAEGRLFVVPWFPDSEIGGVNQAVLGLIRAIERRGGVRPSLLVSGMSRLPDSARHFPCQATALLLRAPDLPATAPFRTTAGFLFHLPATLLRLQRLIRASSIRSVQCVFPDTECVYFAFLRRLGLFSGKLVLWFQGNEIVTAMQKNRLGRWWMRWLLRQADRVVACSRGLLEDILRFEPRCEQRSAVIYNAVDAEGFQRRALSAERWLPDSLRGLPFLLNIARFEPKKGHDILLRAFERIAHRWPALQLVMIGASVAGESAAVRCRVDESPVRDRIVMLENVPHEHVPAFYKHASLFVLASRREGFPFVLLEAGAARLPVVASACIGVPELIEDGVTGRLAPVEDDAALAQAMEDLLGNEPEARRLAENLHRRVLENFVWDALLERHLAL